MNEKIDLTDLIAKGNVKEICDELTAYLNKGYNKLYWDGYDSHICIFQELQPERSKREDMEVPSHLPDKGWPDKNAGFP